MQIENNEEIGKVLENTFLGRELEGVSLIPIIKIILPSQQRRPELTNNKVILHISTWLNIRLQFMLIKCRFKSK
jgi:hypothetical protein